MDAGGSNGTSSAPPVVTIPQKWRKAFAGLSDVPVYFIGPVSKKSRRLDAQNRVLVLTAATAFLALPTGEVRRAVKITDVTAVMVGTKELALRTSAFDTLVEFAKEDELEEFLYAFLMLHGGGEDLVSRHQNVIRETQLKLGRPAGYCVSVDPIETVLQVYQRPPRSLQASVAEQPLPAPPAPPSSFPAALPPADPVPSPRSPPSPSPRSSSSASSTSSRGSSSSSDVIRPAPRPSQPTQTPPPPSFAVSATQTSFKLKHSSDGASQASAAAQQRSSASPAASTQKGRTPQGEGYCDVEVPTGDGMTRIVQVPRGSLSEVQELVKQMHSAREVLRRVKAESDVFSTPPHGFASPGTLSKQPGSNGYTSYFREPGNSSPPLCNQYLLDRLDGVARQLRMAECDLWDISTGCRAAHPVPRSVRYL